MSSIDDHQLITQENELLEKNNNNDLKKYLNAATSNNTRKAYQSDIRHFIAWGGLLPATSDIIINYLHAFAATLNSRTLSRRLVAIKNWHIYQGFSDPTQHPVVKKTMAGIFNVHGKPKIKARAIGLEDLHKIATHLLQDNSLTAIRNCALILVGFYGAFRRSELVQIQFEHLTFSAQGVEILIPRSKTDQTGEGTCCAIPYNHTNLCPVAILLQWLNKANIQQGYVFRNIKSEQVLLSSLTAQSISLILKKLARQYHLTQIDLLSSHSLRRGFATVASARGVSFVSIMRHGRWRHEGTVMGYIEEGRLFEDNALLKIYDTDIAHE